MHPEMVEAAATAEGGLGPAPEIRASAEIAVNDVVRFYQHGWHSWCESRWVDPTKPPRLVADPIERMGHADPLHAFDTSPGGSGFGAVEHSDGTVTLLGALAGGAWVHMEAGRLIGTYEDGQGPWLSLTGAEADVFKRYASLLAAALGRRGGGSVRLWSSWYSYYEDVSEKLMREALTGLDGLGFDVIQIDDGWQRAIGDWTPNNDFPSGMAAMADGIRATGRSAGLWLAPFIASPDSDLVADRPELLLLNANGDPVVAGVNWGAPYWALDLTRQDTLEHLEQLFTGLQGAGYDFFKLDFIYAGAMPGHHQNPMPRSDAYRNACLRIREAVGNDTYLLACGAPIIESIGVFDGIRIGPDVGPVWDDGTYAAAHRAMVTALHRLWLRPAIDPDPDVVYFRQTDLSEDTARHLREMAQIAGFKGTSDPPEWLATAERERLADFLSDRPQVQQRSRYVWLVGDREVDFEPVLSASQREPQWEGIR